MDSHILYESQLGWPQDWTAVFHRQAPLIIEIGFGGGHFLIDLAQKRPFANVLGVEISVPSLRRGVQKARVAAVDNVRVLQSNALYVFWTLCEPHSVDAVFINFPDPWPKASHHRRRIINDRFLHLLATRLKRGGTLDIATDHADYAAWITAHMVRTPFFDSRLHTPYATEDNERLRTKYELTAIAAGRTCYYYKYQRNDVPADNTFPPLKELPMPHVLLHTPISLGAIRDSFDRERIAYDAIHVALAELFEARDEPKLLVEVYVKEEPLAQRVGVVIRQLQPGEWMISLHEIGFPRVTAGIHLAIAAVVKKIAGLHPDTQIIKSNLPETVMETLK